MVLKLYINAMSYGTGAPHDIPLTRMLGIYNIQVAY
jgi:hypothetical protein